MTEVKLNPVPSPRKPSLYDFDVVCDETNNDAATVDRNELRVDVYLPVARSYEVIDRNTQKTILRLYEFPSGRVVVHVEENRHD